MSAVDSQTENNPISSGISSNKTFAIGECPIDESHIGKILVTHHVTENSLLAFFSVILLT